LSPGINQLQGTETERQGFPSTADVGQAHPGGVRRGLRRRRHGHGARRLPPPHADQAAAQATRPVRHESGGETEKHNTISGAVSLFRWIVRLDACGACGEGKEEGETDARSQTVFDQMI